MQPSVVASFMALETFGRGALVHACIVAVLGLKGAGLCRHNCCVCVYMRTLGVGDSILCHHNVWMVCECAHAHVSIHSYAGLDNCGGSCIKIWSSTCRYLRGFLGKAGSVTEVGVYLLCNNIRRRIP